MFDPAPGAYTGVQHVTLTSATPGATFQLQHRWPESGLRRQHALRRPHRDQQLADAQGRGLRDRLLRQPGHQRRLRHHAAARAIGVEAASTSTISRRIRRYFAAGSHSTNETGNAVNISGRGKVESTQQVFHYVYASVTGDFVFTARLDGVDFAGLASNQGRVGLLLTPDITATGNELRLRSAACRRRRHSSGAATASPCGKSANSTIDVTGTGARYLQAHAHWQHLHAARSRSTAARPMWRLRPALSRPALPRDAVRRLRRSARAATRISASATFSDVHIRDPAGNVLIGPDEFTGEIGAGTGGGGTRPAAHRPVASGRPVARRHAGRAAAAHGSVARYNLEGFAAGPVTGGGNIPDTRSALSQGDHGHRTGGRAAATRRRRAPIPVKVIEIMNDLNMGWNEVGTLLQAQTATRCAGTSRPRNIRR